jgi:NAD(P)-dependent dehydrogenase (short-subunit alcohol dehydrogenase family)
MQEFEGKVAVVTGAASGMGRAFAERFAQEGMKVVLADVEEQALETAVRELRRGEFDVLGVVTNVAVAAEVENLASRTLETYGKVHVVCNNAGVALHTGQGVWEYSLNDWQWLMGVNFWGVLHGIRTFVPIMIAQDEECHIVNTSSLAGLVAGSGAYGATKHAVVSLSESLYTELQVRRLTKIGVSVLCPGLVDTRIADAERNRPSELQNAGDGSSEEQRSRVERMLEWSASDGLPPARVAEIVLDGIREGRFYLRTDDKVTKDIADGWVQTRMDNIIQRRNPVAREIPLPSYLRQ